MLFKYRLTFLLIVQKFFTLLATQLILFLKLWRVMCIVHNFVKIGNAFIQQMYVEDLLCAGTSYTLMNKTDRPRPYPVLSTACGHAGTEPTTWSLTTTF